MADEQTQQTIKQMVAVFFEAARKTMDDIPASEFEQRMIWARTVAEALHAEVGDVFLILTRRAKYQGEDEAQEGKAE